MALAHPYLRVKIRSLAEEAKIIKHEERKWLAQGRWLRKATTPDNKAEHAYATHNSLQCHRWDLRVEARAALLAYGFLRGRAYRQIERDPYHLRPPTFSKPGPNWSRVQDLLVKYGAMDKKAAWDAIVKWRDVPPAQAKAA